MAVSVRWITAAAIATVLVATAVGLSLSLRSTQGAFVYALDDPYIHMAMAKNVASHGVWGISRDSFSSSSSSPLWTGGLALAFLVVGVRESLPFILNVVLSAGLLLVVAQQLQRSAAATHPWLLGLTLLTVGLAAPLPALAFAGLEHVLHALLVLLFLDRAAWELSAEAEPTAAVAPRTLLVLAALLPLVRFESLFLIALVTGAVLLKGQFRRAMLIGICAVLPVVIYGAISVWAGWYWLPNSVLLKGSRPELGSLRSVIDAVGYISYSRLREVPVIAFLLYGSLAAFVVRAALARADRLRWKLGLFALMTLAHAQYAQPQPFWFYRYEAYVVVSGVCVLGEVVAEWFDQLRSATDQRARVVAVIAGLLLLGFSPLTERAVRSFSLIPQATTNIYEQHYQIGRFLNTYYQGEVVALNDIGLPSFAADLRTVDLVGLANMDVARRRFRGWYMADDIEDISMAAGVRVAVVYDSWFQGRIPATWERAGTWTISNNVVTGGAMVTLYAVAGGEGAALRRNLREFGATLPATVHQAP